MLGWCGGRWQSHTFLTFSSLVGQSVLPLWWSHYSISKAIGREGREEGRKVDGLELWENSMQCAAERASAARKMY